MLFMVGVHEKEDKTGEIIGFRLLNIHTGDIVNITHDKLINLINSRRIIVENLYLNSNKNRVEECGGKMEEYPRIIGGREYHSKSMVIVRMNREDDIICATVSGILYNIGKLGMSNIENYKFKLVNQYILRGGLIVRGGKALEVDDYTNDSTGDSIKRYNNKCSLLGYKVPMIKNVGGNITLIAVDSSIESMVIPKFVTHIGDYAFEKCWNLKTVDLHDNIKYIGNYAFSWCNELKFIEIPESVREIGVGAFSCSGLEEIKIKANIKEIMDSTFERCRSLKEIKIPDTVKFIGAYAFMACVRLKGIHISNQVKQIGNRAFFASGIAEAVLEGDLEELSEGIFSECNNLNRVKIKDTIKIIGDCAFSFCNSLNRIEIIGKSQLINIELPSKLEVIGDEAFDKCSEIDYIVMPDTVKELGNNAFLDCTNLKSVRLSDNIEVIKRFTFNSCKELQSIDIPGSIKQIEDNAFSCCASLKDVIVRNKNIIINEDAFDGCTNLSNNYIKIADEHGKLSEVSLSDIYDRNM